MLCILNLSCVFDGLWFKIIHYVTVSNKQHPSNKSGTPKQHTSNRLGTPKEHPSNTQATPKQQNRFKGVSNTETEL